ncbi:hypothetical protein [Methylobacterium organophilum]|uniref:Uncharacterized protein n=1 Tax=Methylobacterium organophilum TaxID=410 RepID=A0ABQ4T607_METOR|nr:hypothetical protein [Methylobacterium organophilum]GJE27087.1 hypothetical protein LKMONMHP_1943 [Methylobacterium organophilum]
MGETKRNGLETYAREADRRSGRDEPSPGPHSPPPPQRREDEPEAGGYERHPRDEGGESRRRTGDGNAKGGYGAG